MSEPSSTVPSTSLPATAREVLITYRNGLRERLRDIESDIEWEHSRLDDLLRSRASTQAKIAEIASVVGAGGE